MRHLAWFWTSLAVILLGSCRVPADSQQPLARPVVVFWTSQPRGLHHITHLAGFPHGNDLLPLLAYLRTQQIIPLAWKAGKSISGEKSAEQIAEYWCAPAFDGSLAIAIDECGGTPESNQLLARALVMARKRRPDLYIAVWNAGILRPVLASAYREAADLVMLESYFNLGDPWRLRMGLNIFFARMWGISGKTIFALGIDNAEGDVVKGRARGWANSREILEKQMRWIRRHAPEMKGIAFFAPRASASLLGAADELAGRLFN